MQFVTEVLVKPLAWYEKNAWNPAILKVKRVEQYFFSSVP